MEVKMIELNDVTMELIQLQSEGRLTSEAIEIIIDTLNKGDIQATYESRNTEKYIDGLGAIRERFIEGTHTMSNLENITNDFNCIMLKYGEVKAIEHLKRIVEPVKKTYYKKYRRH